MLAELIFYERLTVIKTNQAFSGNARSYKVETVEKKDPIVYLEASTLSTKDLFSDLLKKNKRLYISDYCKSFLKKIQA